MSKLLRLLKPIVPDYVDSRFDGTPEEFSKCLQNSTALYVGNLSFYTTEEQVYELFSRAGSVKQVVMGLDKFRMTPCGFCFVVYHCREDAENCVRYLNGVKFDNRAIRVDLDWGGEFETRKFGRGRSGGQVRDEHRDHYDAERGGWGKIVQKNLVEIAKQQMGDKEEEGGGMAGPPPHWEANKKPKREERGEWGSPRNRRGGEGARS
ncbi:hypothetical protein BSKO_09041 [Bryopsis sp. KO-2023]|nr:hypothetical protein BSKO_09041 [Bryopsis sp. KO-2023]